MMFRIGEDGDVKVTGRPQSVEEALEFSIDKWEFIRDNASDIITDGGTSTCGLCSMFARLACDGCQSRCIPDTVHVKRRRTI